MTMPEVIIDRDGAYGSDTYVVSKKFPSLSSPLSPPEMASDYYMEVAQGNVPGATAFYKFGRNADIDTSVEDIWDGGGTWVAPTADRIHDLTGGSNDTAAGTGARTVEVVGLSGGLETTETVTMNGTTPVPTTNAYGIIYRMRVQTVGSAGANQANIDATAQVDTTLTARITTGLNQTLMAIYQIPSNKVAYVYDYSASINKGSQGISGNLRFVVKENLPGAPFQVKLIAGIQSEGTSSLVRPILVPSKIESLSIIKAQADTSTNNVDVSASFNLILIDA